MKSDPRDGYGRRLLRRYAVAIGLVLLTLLGLGLLLIGPDLVDYQRFEAAITAHDGEKAIPGTVAVCVSCHGVGGNSASQAYPRLSGQSADYLARQLRNFASGYRRNPIMSPLAKGLSDAEVVALAGYFAAQAPRANKTFHAEPDAVAKGKEAAITAGCDACHGAQLDGTGIAPRLSGQGYQYLVRQLGAFKAGSRRDAGNAMAAVAAKLTDADIDSLAQYFAEKNE